MFHRTVSDLWETADNYERSVNFLTFSDIHIFWLRAPMGGARAMVGLWLASLALAVGPGAGSSQSVNAVQGPCARMVEFAVGRTSASGRTAVPDKDVLAAYCRSSWPERAADCDVLAAGMVREAAPGTAAPALRVRFCGEQAAAAASKGKPTSRAAPRPSLLSSLAAVFFPVRSKHGEAWGNTQPLETARSTVTVARAVDMTQGSGADRQATLSKARPQPHQHRSLQMKSVRMIISEMQIFRIGVGLI